MLVPFVLAAVSSQQEILPCDYPLRAVTHVLAINSVYVYKCPVISDRYKAICWLLHCTLPAELLSPDIMWNLLFVCLSVCLSVNFAYKLLNDLRENFTTDVYLRTRKNWLSFIRSQITKIRKVRNFDIMITMIRWKRTCLLRHGVKRK